MPRIHAKADNLNTRNSEFEQQRLRTPVFLNSVPKCGTHLLRNIFRMFVPVPQQYHQMFIQIPVLHQHLAAFNAQNPMLSWGHLLFSDESAYALSPAKHVLIVRDPYDWVLARTRFFLSDSFDGQLEHLKQPEFSQEQLFNMMIFGIHQKAPSMAEIFTHNAVSWLGTDITLVKFEELVQHVQNLNSDAAHHYFVNLFNACEITLPEDWRKRIEIGSDREQSGTARENLYGNHISLPEKLPEMQRQLVDFAIPGLRSLLGYDDY